MSKKNPFKIGDMVKCVSREGTNYNIQETETRKHPYKLGKSYIVNKVMRDDYICVEGVEVGEFVRCFELVRKDEKYNFFVKSLDSIDLNRIVKETGNREIKIKIQDVTGFKVTVE